jgi:hypothetical protein
MVWAIAHIMVDALFEAGHQTVVLDACVIAGKHKEWKSRKYELELKKFNVPEKECIARAEACSKIRADRAAKQKPLIRPAPFVCV